MAQHSGYDEHVCYGAEQDSENCEKDNRRSYFSDSISFKIITAFFLT